MYYKKYLEELEVINTEIGFLQYGLDQVDPIIFNPFSRMARWQRAVRNKIRELEREIGVLNYRFHGDESFPNPVFLMDKIEDDNRF